MDDVESFFFVSSPSSHPLYHVHISIPSGHSHHRRARYDDEQHGCGFPQRTGGSASHHASHRATDPHHIHGRTTSTSSRCIAEQHHRSAFYIQSTTTRWHELRRGEGAPFAVESERERRIREKPTYGLHKSVRVSHIGQKKYAPHHPLHHTFSSHVCGFNTINSDLNFK
jgi:hypothetical protein